MNNTTAPTVASSAPARKVFGFELASSAESMRVPMPYLPPSMFGLLRRCGDGVRSSTGSGSSSSDARRASAKKPREDTDDVRCAMRRADCVGDTRHAASAAECDEEATVALRMDVREYEASGENIRREKQLQNGTSHHLRDDLTFDRRRINSRTFIDGFRLRSIDGEERGRTQ